MDETSKYARRCMRRALNTQYPFPTKIREEAKKIYKESIKKGFTDGRSEKYLAVTSIYTACRKYNYPLTLKEISNDFSLSSKAIGRYYRLFLSELGINVGIDYPMKYIPKLVKKLGLSEKTESLAIEILERAKEKRLLIGRNPIGIAATSLYVASITNDEKHTKQEIADLAKVTEATIRKNLKILGKI